MARQDNYYDNDLHVSKDNASDKGIPNINKSAKLQIRQEELKISKELRQMAIVSVHKDSFTEEKIVKVPVNREELVIERKVLDSEDKNVKEGSTEIIRIPIKEERIEVKKHPIVLEDVKIYKHQYKEIEHIEELLKKEKIILETTGEPKIIEKRSE